MVQCVDIVALFAFHINHVHDFKIRAFLQNVPPGGPRYQFNNSSSDMGYGKDLAEVEKVLVIKEIAEVKTNKSIAKRINRCVMTEIGESVRIFRKILQRGNLGLIAVV